MSRIAKRERGIWQRRFWEHMIRDDTDFRAHLDYIHFNPVKHGLVSHPRLWPYSSYHRAIARGEIEADHVPASCPDTEFGERPPTIHYPRRRRVGRSQPAKGAKSRPSEN